MSNKKKKNNNIYYFLIKSKKDVKKINYLKTIKYKILDIYNKCWN